VNVAMNGTPYGEDTPRPVVTDHAHRVESLMPTDPETPNDFDAFWKTTLDNAAGYRLRLRREIVATPLRSVVVEDLSFVGCEGTTVHAWLIWPPSSDPLPLVVQFCGYGTGRGLPVEHLAWASAGFAHLVIDSRGQGSDTPDHPLEAGSGHDGHHVARGLARPEYYYYRRLVVDAVRAVEAARTLPEVDPLSPVLLGASQGGGLALAVSALVDRVGLLLCDIPFMCQWQRAMQTADRGPYADLSSLLASRPELAEPARRTLSYFDGVSFARRATAPALFSVALRDRVCPPSTVLAAYDAYSGPKDLATYPHNDHEGGGAFHLLRQLAHVHKHYTTGPTSAPAPLGTQARAGQRQVPERQPSPEHAERGKRH
jgi:cephalosporin-C deacetylase